VKVDALALEDEGADAVLLRGLARAEHVDKRDNYLRLCHSS
jgi:hypothetical protein